MSGIIEVGMHRGGRQMSWTVGYRASRGRDVNGDYPIQVLSPQRRPRVTLDRSLLGTLDECPMTLVIHDRDVGAGEMVKATFGIMPRQDLHATAVETYLVLDEVTRTEAGTRVEATEFGRTRLAQRFEVPAGHVSQFPIEIPLAYDLVPSRLSPCTEAIWKLMAMARRRLHHDLWVAAFLNVYNENLISCARPDGRR